MALFTRVQHLCTFNIFAPFIYHLLPNVWKASYNISTSIIVDVPYWPPYSKDKFTSCVVLGLSQWFFHFGKEIIIAWTPIGWVWWMFQTLPLPVPKRSVKQQCDFLHCHEELWGSIPPSVVVFSWVHAIMICSLKWKNHCEGPSTTQDMKLSIL